MSKANSDDGGGEDPQTTTINIRVTEHQLEEIDRVWKEEGFTSRSEFLRSAIRDATAHPGVSRQMLATIAAEEYAMRQGDTEAVSREDVLSMMDDGE
jgi:Arc/MetJ-type ribon-helix-helix transcriptional regulator